MNSTWTKPVTVDDVLITNVLAHRPSRIGDDDAPYATLAGLGSRLTTDLQQVAQSVVEAAIDLCRADSAGICVLEAGDAGGVLRLSAVAGPMAVHAGARIPADEWPCGTAIRRDAVLLFAQPSKYFPALRGCDPGVAEMLVVPWSVDDIAAGTIWVCAHTDGERFCARDARRLADLGAFAAAAFRLSRALEAARQAREAERRKDEFLVTLAHELRNPLGSISNVAELLVRTRARQGDSERAIGMLARQVRHVMRLVDDLLDVSRIARGKIDCELKPTALAEVVRSAVETCRPLFEEAGQTLAVALPETPITVAADAVRLAQIIANLLHNAVKYSECGARTWLTVSHDANEDVEISVRDSGAGIPQEQLGRVFEMFAQAHRDSRGGRRGLGIGLAMVQKLVELHGGQVEARSAGAGRGSEFIVRLPPVHVPIVLASGDLAAPAAPALPSFNENMNKPVDPPFTLSPEDYDVACGQKVNGLGCYIAYLRIRRKKDGKLIYPFDGCEVPGPFATPEEARHAARAMADQLVRLDIARPEH